MSADTRSGEWQWKDEDDLAALVDAGYYSAREAIQIHEEGLRVVGRVESWSAPFCGGWEQWRPSLEEVGGRESPETAAHGRSLGTEASG